MRFACAKIRTIYRLIYKVIYGSTVVVCLASEFFNSTFKWFISLLTRKNTSSVIY